VDVDGRVIGVGGLDLPRGARRAGMLAGPVRIALPAAPLARSLATFDLPRGGAVESRTPSYTCPGCNATFAPDNERCLACGARLPHTFDADRGTLPAETLVRELLATLGSVSATLRMSPRQWRLIAPAGGEAGPRSTQPMVRRNIEVLFEIDEAGK